VSDLPKDQVCTKPPEYSWFEIREGINRMLREKDMKVDEQGEKV